MKLKHTDCEEDCVIARHIGLDHTEALITIIENLDDAISGRDETIAELRAQIQDLEDEIAILRSEGST